VSAVRGADVAKQPDYVERNRAAWQRWAPYHRAVGRRGWVDVEQRWGLWGVLESELGILNACEPESDAIELGCGSGQLCAWLVRAGLRPVGVDIAQAQIDNAVAFQHEFGIEFRVDRVNAEAVPYDDASFDLAISEYGASVWCDPYRWVPEAARLVRPGGMLVFITTAPFLMACTASLGGTPGEKLERPYFGMHRFEFSSDDTVEFHLGHGDWFRVLTENGFVVEQLIEVRPDPNAVPRYSFVSNAWARQWPSEDIWIARRR
jgi:SAM-dependent methyltransferase